MLWEFHSPSHGVEGPQQVETLPYDTPLAFGGSVKVLPGAETSEVSKGFQGKDPQRPWRQEQKGQKRRHPLLPTPAAKQGARGSE